MTGPWLWADPVKPSFLGVFVRVFLEEWVANPWRFQNKMKEK